MADDAVMGMFSVRGRRVVYKGIERKNTAKEYQASVLFHFIVFKSEGGVRSSK